MVRHPAYESVLYACISTGCEIWKSDCLLDQILVINVNTTKITKNSVKQSEIAIFIKCFNASSSRLPIYNDVLVPNNRKWNGYIPVVGFIHFIGNDKCLLQSLVIQPKLNSFTISGIKPRTISDILRNLTSRLTATLSDNSFLTIYIYIYIYISACVLLLCAINDRLSVLIRASNFW